MPRLVNLPSSESSSEDDSSPTQQRIYNHRPAYRTTASRERYTGYLSYSQRSMINFNEDEVYCLSRIIDGKVRKFKKDSRTWLHKSSSKIKKRLQKPDTDKASIVYNLPTQCSLLNESKNSSESTEINKSRIYNTSNTRAETDTDNSSEEMLESYTEYYMCDNLAAVNSNNREHHKGRDIDEDYMYIGDSDADLTYEEENVDMTVNNSGNSHQTKESASLNSNKSQQDSNGLHGNEPSNFSLVVSGSLDLLEQESFEHLDLCNESGNSVKYPHDMTEISRKLAPAIEIEKESYRENLLDYVVNKSACRVPERSEATTCCDKIYRKLRSRAGNKTSDTDCGGSGSVRPRRSQRSATNTCTKSRLRRVNKDKKMNGAKKSNTKRIRFAEDVRCQQQQSEHMVAREPVKCTEPEVVGNSDMPSCSKENGASTRSTVPSLFVIAGFVLYGMYKSNFEQE